MFERQLLFFSIALFVLGTNAAKFTLQNKCNVTIWPGTLSGKGPLLIQGGTTLNPSQSISFDVPEKWSGRIWPRTGCKFDASGKGNCATGDCGGSLHCGGIGGQPPATLAEFTLDEMNFFDVSIVDGSNTPISIYPSNQNCKPVECFRDLNAICPKELQVSGPNGQVVSCKSACMKFDTPEYCCTGAYGSPQTCKASEYAKLFKAACPSYYSYAYDDPTSTFTCKGTPDYLIRFC